MSVAFDASGAANCSGAELARSRAGWLGDNEARIPFHLLAGQQGGRQSAPVVCRNEASTEPVARSVRVPAALAPAIPVNANSSVNAPDFIIGHICLYTSCLADHTYIHRIHTYISMQAER